MTYTGFLNWSSATLDSRASPEKADERGGGGGGGGSPTLFPTSKSSWGAAHVLTSKLLHSCCILNPGGRG